MILWEMCYGCDVDSRQARKSRGLPALNGHKCKHLSNLSCPCAPSVSPGREVWTSRMNVSYSGGLARVGDHLETFCLPQAP